MEEGYKDTLMQVVSTLDAFGNGLDLQYVLSLPLPFLKDIFDSRIEYLKIKNKAQQEAYEAARNG